MKKVFSIIFLSLGILYLSKTGYILVKSELSQYFIHQAWQDTLLDKENHKPWTWADTFPIMQLHVPRINQSSYILDGASPRTLAFSAARISSSGMPGQSKSTIVSGHKDSHFDYLKKIRIGDKIIVQDKNQSHGYIVNATNIIDSKKEKILIRNINELVLTTCYPFSDLQLGGSLRFIVYAVPVNI